MDENYVPAELQFQRYANDPNLGKQTSDLMRLSPVFYQRFGATDISLRAHLADVLAGMWEYLVDEAPYRAPLKLGDVAGSMDYFWTCAYETLADTGAKPSGC